MKALLINPPNRFWLFPPLGLAYISSSLKKAGHHVRMLDMTIQSNLEATINLFKPDMIGITATSQTFQNALATAKKCRTHTRAKIIFGGSHASAVPEETIKHSEVDAVITGEAEQSMAEAMHTRKKIIKAGIINRIDDLPWPDREGLPMELYDNPGSIITSRGCPHQCCFCAHHVSGYTWRGRSPDDVVKEIRMIRDNYTSEIHIADDNFSMDINRAKRIMELLMEKNMGLKMWFFNGLRADRVDAELLLMMREAGAQLISYGLESTNTSVLENIGKRIRLEQVEHALELTKATGIKTRLSMMIGNPGETMKTTLESIEWVKRNNNIDTAEFSIATVYPGTALFRWVKENGRMLTSVEDQPTYFMDDQRIPSFETNEFTAEERVKALRIAQRMMQRRLAFRGKSLKNFRIRGIPTYARTMVKLVTGDTARKFRK